jgi:hypothetical protein
MRVVETAFVVVHVHLIELSFWRLIQILLPL